VPGLVDQATGTVARAPNLDWNGVPLRRLLAGRVPAALGPVLVENEANVAALGELWFGDGASLGDYVHISGEIGVGAGIVVGGQLFRGAHGHAGERCLELFCGQEAILRRAGLDPDTVVLGGIYAVLAPWLRASFQRALLAGIPMTRAAPPRIAISALGPDAAARGAAGLVTARLLARPGELLPASARAWQ